MFLATTVIKCLGNYKSNAVRVLLYFTVSGISVLFGDFENVIYSVFM